MDSLAVVSGSPVHVLIKEQVSFVVNVLEPRVNLVTSTIFRDFMVMLNNIKAKHSSVAAKLAALCLDCTATITQHLVTLRSDFSHLCFDFTSLGSNFSHLSNSPSTARSGEPPFSPDLQLSGDSKDLDGFFITIYDVVEAHGLSFVSESSKVIWTACHFTIGMPVHNW